MGTKMHRVVLFVLDINQSHTKEEIKNELENVRYPEFLSVKEVKTADIGEYDDNHILNKTAATRADYEKYFPELNQSAQIQNQELINLRDKFNALDLENQKLKQESDELRSQMKKYDEVLELVKKIKGV